jgi:hypothetical protein
MSSLEETGGRIPAPEGWVPVDRRWLGLDKQTIAPALVVLLLALVMIFAVPAIDRAVPGGRPVQPGEVLGLNGGVQFTPSRGWTVVDGAAVGDPTRSGSYPDTATVTSGAVSFAVTTGKFSGTPEELLTQIESLSERAGAGRGAPLTGSPRPVRTTSGEQGVMT